jgi:Nif-specific regulatory protein
MNIDRFRVLKKLGTGQSGIVYKVQDTMNNKVLALKMLNPGKGDRDTVLRLKQEFSFARELNHPNLARVYDFGSAKLKDKRTGALGVRYFFTMDYIEGTNIFHATRTARRKGYGSQTAARARTATDGQVIWKNVYPLVVQICRALEYIHSRGLIHYDVKPGNVMVTGTTVKLLDFGLAREQITQDGEMIRGTIPYMAPEIIKGLQIDRRVDLYSLGVLLYEMITGRLPFDGDSSTVLGQHIADIPAPLQKLNKEIPGAFQRIVLKLLEKEPSDRFQGANDVIREINKSTGTRYRTETKEIRESRILTARFVGRKKELERLKKAFRNLKSRQENQGARILLISGESGIGKSRLVQEFKSWVQLNKGTTLNGRCYESETIPYQGFIEPLQKIVSYGSSEILAKYAPYVAGIVPGISKKVKRVKSLIPLEPPQEKIRLLDNLTRFITEVLTNKAFAGVFLIEDLQWADEDTIELLTWLARSAALGTESSLLICGTYRTQELEQILPLKRMIDKIKAEKYCEEVPLGRLNESDTTSLVTSMLGKLPDEVTRKAYLSAEGNPFFVQEIARTLIANSVIRHENGIWQADIKNLEKLEIPYQVEKIVSRRLATLDNESLRVASTASVIGKGFDSELLASASGCEQEELYRIITGLLRLEIFREKQTHDRYEYEFAHTQIREVLYKRLTSPEKKALHEKVGNSLERIHRGAEEVVVDRLAYHFIAAANKQKGVSYGIKTAKKSKKTHAHERSIDIYEAVLDLLQPTDVKQNAQVLEDLADSLITIGNYEEAERRYHALLSFIASDREKSAEIRAKLGSVYSKKGEYDTAIQHLETSLENASKKALPEVLVRLGTIYFRKSDYDSARRFLNQALDQLGGTEESEIAGHVWSTLVGVHAHLGKYREALRCSKKSLDIFKSLKNKPGLAAGLTNSGNIHYAINELKQALQCYEKGVKLADEIGDRPLAAMVLDNLGNAHCRTEDYSRAAECSEKSLRIRQRIGDKWGTANSLNNLANIYTTQGQYSKGVPLLRKGLVIMDSVGDEFLRATYFNHLGSIYDNVCAYSRAISYYRKALSIREEINVRPKIAESLIHLGRVYVLVGKKKAGSRYLNKALKMYTDLKDKSGICWTLIDVADLHLANGNYAAGFETVDKALKVAQSQKNNELLAGVLTAKGRLLAEPDIAESRAKERRQWLNDLQEIAGLVQKPEALWNIYSAIGRVYDSLNEIHEATIYYKKSVDAITECCKRIDDEKLEKSYMSDNQKQEVLNRVKEMEGQEKESRSPLVHLSQERLITLYEIGKTINSVLELDKTTHELSARASRHMDRETIEDAKDISQSIIKDVAKHGMPLLATDVSTIPNLKQRESIILHRIKSVMCVPLRIRDEIIGTIYVDDTRSPGSFSEEDVSFLAAFSDQIATAIENARLREELLEDVKYLRQEVEGLHRFESIVGAGREMQEVYATMQAVIGTDATVLIQGETGTGKELVAKAIHYNGPRKKKKFVAIACGALPETLLESELFGHVKGAFTGASSEKKGLFEIAHEGTLFLDDVVDMTLSVQPKLLRVLEEKEIRRVGSTSSIGVDVRIMASTNKPLTQQVETGEFREDLFYRLNVVTIKLPPLRERRSDIPQLASHFLKLYSDRMGKKIRGFRKETMDLFLSYNWPGNVREMENVIESAVIVAGGPNIEPEDVRRIRATEQKEAGTELSLRQTRQSAEITRIRGALSKHSGNVTHAAKELGIDRRSLRRLIQKHGIKKIEY